MLRDGALRMSTGGRVRHERRRRDHLIERLHSEVPWLDVPGIAAGRAASPPVSRSASTSTASSPAPRTTASGCSASRNIALSPGQAVSSSASAGPPNTRSRSVVDTLCEFSETTRRSLSDASSAPEAHELHRAVRSAARSPLLGERAPQSVGLAPNSAVRTPCRAPNASTAPRASDGATHARTIPHLSTTCLGSANIIGMRTRPLGEDDERWRSTRSFGPGGRPRCPQGRSRRRRRAPGLRRRGRRPASRPGHLCPTG